MPSTSRLRRWRWPLHLTEAWGIRGAFNHNWDPYWSTSLFGSYAAVRYDDTAKAPDLRASYAPGKAVSADFTCNPDFNVAQLGVVTRWTPVKNLTFSAEVLWFHLDQKFTGSAALTPAAPKPGAAQGARYELQGPGRLSARTSALSVTSDRIV